MKVFKKGDLVRRIGHDYGGIRTGDIVEVEECLYAHSGLGDLLKIKGYISSAYDPSLFELYEAKVDYPHEVHPHADVICHYVKGGDIQVQYYGKWVDCERYNISTGILTYMFRSGTKYRIKPTNNKIEELRKKMKDIEKELKKELKDLESKGE